MNSSLQLEAFYSTNQIAAAITGRRDRIDILGFFIPVSLRPAPAAQIEIKK